MQERYYIGFDLGGTKMLACVLNDEFEIIASSKKKTRGISSEDDLIERMSQCIDEALADVGVPQISGIGVAVPGIVDTGSGKVRQLTNLNLWDVDIAGRLNSRYLVPVIAENDVNAGVYGEYRFGKHGNVRHVIGLFIGTGIGGGIILDGKLFHGAHGGAGEIGHMILQTDGPMTPIGIAGTLEGLASKTALARDMVMLAGAGYSPSVLETAGTDISAVKSSVIKKALDAGEQPIRQLVDRSIGFLGKGMASCVHIFNPELIILGGGIVEKLGDEYVQAAEAAMRASAMPVLADAVKVSAAVLGDDAVPLGAGALIADYISERNKG